VVKLPLTPGAEPERDIRELRFVGGAAPETRRVRIKPGIELAPLQEPLTIGDPSRRLRVIATSFVDGRYVARLQGLSGRTYSVRLRVPFQIESLAGGQIVRKNGAWTEVAIAFPAADAEWLGKDLTITVGRRVPS
jgi:hypothetical protein